MTDYYGVSNTGSGNLGGTTNLVNLTYVKKIGIDIASQNSSTFSFDVQVSAMYKASTPSQTSTGPVNTTTSFPSNINNSLDKFSI